MPISTTDVVTNVVSGVETSNNGSSVTYCMRTGSYQSSHNNGEYIYEAGINYNDFSTKYANRFDDVTYYTVGINDIIGA